MTPDTPSATNFYTLVYPNLIRRIEAAERIEGVGVANEVALVRTRLAEFMDAHPHDMDILIKCVRVIIGGMTADHRMRPKDGQMIEASAIEAIRDLAAQFLPPPEAIDV